MANPTDNINVPYPNTPATTIKPLNEDDQNELAPSHSQTTHPSTTSHESGEQGRPAVSDAHKKNS